MASVNLEHSNVDQYQARIMKQSRQLRQVWMKGRFCDVVVKSRDGTEHKAHSLVLSAASTSLENLLAGPFLEGGQVRNGMPVEIAASEAVVTALLDYLYGGQPEVQLEDSLELLRLADAYDLPELATAMEAGLRSSLTTAPVASVLQLLEQTRTQGLYDLQDACEEKVAANFESSIQHPEFLKLSPGPLTNLLRREDLVVSREDVVLQGIFRWFNSNKQERGPFLCTLFPHVDFESISIGNLSQLDCFAASLGPNGNDLQREVLGAVRAHRRKRSAPESQADAFRPKRRCLSNWSSDLGASSEDFGKKVLSTPLFPMRLHKGAIYGRGLGLKQILRWKPGDSESRAVAGEGARVAGINDLGTILRAAVLPDGEILAADRDNNRLVSFQNGFGRVLLSDVEGLLDVVCSTNGVVYVLSQDGRALQKLVGSTLQPFIESKNLPEELQFEAGTVFVTKEEVLYLTDWDNHRILRFSPGESKPVVAATLPAEMSSGYLSIFVLDSGKIYVCVEEHRVVLALHPGETSFTEVLRCPGNLMPVSALVLGRSLYVTMSDGVYEYFLPPELQLECWWVKMLRAWDGGSLQNKKPSKNKKPSGEVSRILRIFGGLAKLFFPFFWWSLDQKLYLWLGRSKSCSRKRWKKWWRHIARAGKPPPAHCNVRGPVTGRIFFFSTWWLKKHEKTWGFGSTQFKLKNITWVPRNICGPLIFSVFLRKLGMLWINPLHFGVIHHTGEGGFSSQFLTILLDNMCLAFPDIEHLVGSQIFGFRHVKNGMAWRTSKSPAFGPSVKPQFWGTNNPSCLSKWSYRRARTGFREVLWRDSVAERDDCEYAVITIFICCVFCWDAFELLLPIFTFWTFVSCCAPSRLLMVGHLAALVMSTFTTVQESILTILLHGMIEVEAQPGDVSSTLKQMVYIQVYSSQYLSIS